MVIRRGRSRDVQSGAQLERPEMVSSTQPWTHRSAAVNLPQQFPIQRNPSRLTALPIVSTLSWFSYFSQQPYKGLKVQERAFQEEQDIREQVGRLKMGGEDLPLHEVGNSSSN